ncbi:MAG: hypothetical protein ACOX4O_05120 [Eubacteriales bacterium]
MHQKKSNPNRVYFAGNGFGLFVFQITALNPRSNLSVIQRKIKQNSAPRHANHINPLIFRMFPKKRRENAPAGNIHQQLKQISAINHQINKNRRRFGKQRAYRKRV